jgi:CO/xanthine dehydrogenase FAD-binding subunit
MGFVSLRALTELAGVRFRDGQWWIGAMTTIADLRANTELSPPGSALGQATRSLGSRQVRNRATVGGNICGGGAERTLIPVLLAYDASVEVVGLGGTRIVALADVLGCERAQLADDEILTAVAFTPVTGPQRYYRISPRNAACYATASVVVVVDEPNRTVRAALGSVGPTAMRAYQAEAIGSAGVNWQRRTVEDDVAEAFGAAAAEVSDPSSDLAATAEYRRHAVAVMARRALRHIFDEEAQ